MLDRRNILSALTVPPEISGSLHLDGPWDVQGKFREGLKRLPKTQEGTILALSVINRLWDPDTARHQRRVGQIAVQIAREMNLPKPRIDGVYVAGILHDIGKIAIPWEILSAPRPLTATEILLVQAHAEAGYEILKSIKFPWPVSQVALQHHERMDGSGYPFGRHGEDLLLESKIVAVADVVEAMSSIRHYRDPLGLCRAVEEITLNRGILYDGRVVDACLRLLVSLEARDGSNGDQMSNCSLIDLGHGGGSFHKQAAGVRKAPQRPEEFD